MVQALIPVQAGIAGVVAFASFALYRRYPEEWAPLDTQPLSRFEPAVAATLLWTLCYYLFLFHESFTVMPVRAALRRAAKKANEKPPSLAAVKYGSAGGVHTLRAKRAVGNMIEQSLPFLAGLWMHAVFVDVASAARLAAVWLSVRGFYPLAFGRFWQGVVPVFFAVTLPNYATIVAMVWPLVVKVAW